MSWEEAVQTLRNDPAARELVRACFYDDPLLGAADRYWKSAEWRAIRAYLPSPPGAALDLGAGRGIASYALAQDGWTVTALEPDPSAIVGAEAIRRLAAEAGLTIEVAQEWGEDLPFLHSSFDVVHCRAVLHHANHLGRLCAEVGRVLKPGGRFIATREHVVSRKEDIEAFQRGHPLHHLYGGEYAYLLREYEDAIQAGGLHIVKTLNPMESDINLYPESKDGIKRMWAARLRLPVARLIPDSFLTWYGGRSRAPGRHYTFVSRKPFDA
jgi:SAM-dependent methyltransferase